MFAGDLRRVDQLPIRRPREAVQSIITSGRELARMVEIARRRQPDVRFLFRLNRNQSSGVCSHAQVAIVGQIVCDAASGAFRIWNKPDLLLGAGLRLDHCRQDSAAIRRPLYAADGRPIVRRQLMARAVLRLKAIDRLFPLI